MNKKKKGIIIGTTTAVALAGIVGTAFIPSVRSWLGDHVFTKSNNLANIGGNKDLSTDNKDDKTDSSITVEEFVKTYKIAVPDSFTGTMKVYPSINGDLLLIFSSAPGVYLYDSEKDYIIQLYSFNITDYIINVGNGDYIMSSSNNNANYLGLYLYDSSIKELRLLYTGSSAYAFSSYCFLPDDTIVLSQSNNRGNSFYIYDINKKLVSVLFATTYTVGGVFKMSDDRVLLCPYNMSNTFAIYDYTTGKVEEFSDIGYPYKFFESIVECGDYIFISATSTSGKSDLLCFNTKTNEFKIVSASVHSIAYAYECDDGSILLSSKASNSNGLFLFDVKTQELREVFNKSYYYDYFYKLSNGNIFAMSKYSNWGLVLDSNTFDVLASKELNWNISSNITDFELPNGNLLLVCNASASMSSANCRLLSVNVKDNTFHSESSSSEVVSIKQLVDYDVLILHKKGVWLYHADSDIVSIYFSGYTPKEIVDNEDGTYTIKFEDFNDVEYSSIKKQFYMIYSVDTEAEAE